MQTTSITKVDKSQLTRISFGTVENQKKSTKSLLRYKLKRAQSLGNLFKLHALILFNGEDGELLETEATVWAVAEKYIMIKGGTVIPISSIIDVRI